MVSHYQILVFAASVAVSWQFCKFGKLVKLECPEDSIINGIETTREIFSVDSRPVCRKLAQHILPDYTSYIAFFKGKNSDFHSYTIPKAVCEDSYAMKSLTFCVEDGEVTRTAVDCRQLKHITPSITTYAIAGNTDESLMECGEKGLLYGIQYDRSNDGSLLAIASCTTYGEAGEDEEADHKEYCNSGQLVEVACPDGYLVTGVQTSSKIFSLDVTPVCSKQADKLFLALKVESIKYYYDSYPHAKADCSGSDPIVLKFDICFENGVVKSTRTQCRRFIENVTVTETIDIEGRTNSSILKCPEGSFFHGLRTERDGTGWYTSSDETDVRVRGKCSFIEI